MIKIFFKNTNNLSMLSTKSIQEIKNLLKIKSDKITITHTETLPKYEADIYFYWSSDQKFLNLAMAISK